MSSKTWKIGPKVMTGSAKMEQELIDRFNRWNIDYPLKVDDRYTVEDRAAWATFLRAWGAESAKVLMEDGITPELRSRVRHDYRTAEEFKLFNSDDRKDYRSALRKLYNEKDEAVSYPIEETALITDAWGWNPGHDGIDLMCPWKSAIFAICDARVVRVSASGWWGKGARPTQGHPIGDGDGIVIIQALESVGPIDKGDCFGYGHSENHVVEVGQRVHAGQKLGMAGWANGAHIHFMHNDGSSKYWDSQRPLGLGSMDPKPALTYAWENS